MNVIKFPGRLRDLGYSEEGQSEQGEGEYQDHYDDAPYHEEFEQGYPPHDLTYPNVTSKRKTSDKSTRPPKGRISPAEIIARSLHPTSSFDDAPRPSPKTPVEVIAGSLNRTGLGSGSDILNQSFWLVWLQHREYLRKKSLYLLDAHREDAEDALSNAMLKAFHHFVDSSGGVENMRGWLSTIVYNACMDGHRHAKRSRDLFTETEAAEYENLASGGGSSAQTPEDIVRAQESLEDLYRLITELPEALRSPLLMRTIDHLSYSEIAQRLQLTEPNVRKRVQQARDLLRTSRLREGIAELLGICPPDR
jgi:RNA polymerase sigma factor (sigma-70 family)